MMHNHHLKQIQEAKQTRHGKVKEKFIHQKEQKKNIYI